MTINPSGHIFYDDAWGQKYEVQWETIGGIIDLTSIVQQPHIWGEKQEGFVKNKVLYRKGVVTIHRQAIELTTGEYVIIAEGISQFCDFIQMNYQCELGPTDPFKYHLDCYTLDGVSIKILEGSRWADSTDVDDINAIWGDLNGDGSPAEDTGTDVLEWVDVWSN